DLGMPDNVSKIDGLDFASCTERSAPEEPGARSSFRLCPAPFLEATRDGIWTAAASQWSPKQTVFFANRQLVWESHCKQRILCAGRGGTGSAQIKTIGP